jgi:acetyltransferase-like isoleucine patch superfamily enzyme
MLKNVRTALRIINSKGLIETLVYSFRLFRHKLFSITKIYFLRIRGYDLDKSVILRGKVFFFQSNKHSIKIDQDVIVGDGNRISAGGKGSVLIGKGVLVDDFTFIMAHEKIEIGKNSKIASFCFITDFNHRYDDKKMPIAKQGYVTDPIMIGDNVWIGTHSVILPGVKIGNNSVIGAGSVVTRSIPANSVAVGNPAKVIKHI